VIINNEEVPMKEQSNIPHQNIDNDVEDDDETYRIDWL
jgi:hypothetical protein